MPRARSTSARRSHASQPPDYPVVRELIVIARLVELEGPPGNGAEVALSPLQALLNDAGGTLEPLFGPTPGRVREMMRRAGVSEHNAGSDLTVYYRVAAPDAALDALAGKLNDLDQVQAAYVKPPAEPPQRLNDMEALLADAPPATPDFVASQLYLGPAPGGIDAHHAWTLPGGHGAGVKIVDIEGEWRFSHEDLLQNQGGVAGGTPPNSLSWRNHGTAVVGVFGADHNTLGVTGICAEANVRGLSIFGGLGSAAAIRQAADMLFPGDIILIELHRAGPLHNYQLRADQHGYIAIEWWPDDFAAIRYATEKGIVVVEAAGNGAQDFDDPLYDAPAPGFPAGWTNPYNRANRDSGAIIVGAGAPPPGTHGHDWGPDRARLGFSNYGASVDAQGWGREVTTCGYGDLQGGSNEDLWYTGSFSGTSSASPVVVGALGALQGVLRARGRLPLSPAAARALLRATGSTQQDGPNAPASQRIGNRPDLRQLIAQATEPGCCSDGGPPLSGVQFSGSVPANGMRRWFTHSWPAAWHVVWEIVPTTPRAGQSPQITWTVHLQRTSDSQTTYWLTVNNISNQAVDVEGRYAVVGW